MKTIAAGVTFLLVFLVGGAYADPGHHGYQHWHCAKDFWGNCAGAQHRWRHHHERRHHHRQHQQYQTHEGLDRGVACHARRRVVGEERTSKNKARRAADDAWMGAVRYDHGERFQDLNHARDVRHNCDPSSILGRVRFRCVVEATPCRAPAGSTEHRVERRYEEDIDDDDDDNSGRRKN